MGRRLLVSRRTLLAWIDSSPVRVLNSRAFGANDVAQVPVLEGGVALFADVVARDVDLEAARAVLQRGKAGLAHDALEHHAAGDPGGDGRGALGRQFLRGFLAVRGQQGGGVVVGLEVVRERPRPCPAAWASRKVLSFSRRSAMSWFSSWGAGVIRGSDMGSQRLRHGNGAPCGRHFLPKPRILVFSVAGTRGDDAVTPELMPCLSKSARRPPPIG